MRNASHYTADVCVYGDTPGAVTAAVSAARQGAGVILAVPSSHVGGILANGLGSNDLDNHDFTNSPAVGGLAAEYFRRVAVKYGDGKGYRTEPHVAEEVFGEMLADAGVDVRYGMRLRETGGVQKKGTRIQALQFENGDSVVADVFVDGTVEGDLMAFSGAAYTYGREGNAKYGETLNGIRQDSNYRQFQVGVDPYWEPGNPDSGLIPTVQNELQGAPGSGDASSMGFCFRMVLTRREGNRIDIEKPESYDPESYEIYRRYFSAGGASGFFKPGVNIPNGKTDIGSWHDLSANLYGYNHGWPDGTYEEREALYTYHREFSWGLLWYLQNDPEVPDMVRDAWSGWGLPADEFQDNGNWPRQLYLRNGRRMISDWVVTEADCTRGNSKVAEDPVGLAYWPPDMHHARRIVRNGQAWNEGFVFGGGIDWRPFGISYRAIRPKADECANLLVPCALSSSYVGYGAVRIEWTFMVLGQSAGTAAAFAAENSLDVQEVTYDDLRPLLLAGGQILGSESLRKTE